MTRVIGIDPGPMPGIVVLEFHEGRLYGRNAVQCTAEVLYHVLRGLNIVDATFVAVERFVPRGRANAAQELTRDQVAQLWRHHDRVVARSASQVKPWATDARLEAAGLLEATKGMRHARDAARHALFAAVKDGGLPDPLSTRFKEQNR